MKGLIILAAALAASGLGGCQSDMVKDAEGRQVERFNAANFCGLVSMWDLHVQHEGEGKSVYPANAPVKKMPTWSESWAQMIGGVQVSMENPQAYIDYLVEHRREAGLPDLDGHPSAGVVTPYDCAGYYSEAVTIKGGMIQWVGQPSVDQVRSAFPVAAVQAQRDGDVDLDCATRADGHLEDCVVKSERPAGLGFGAAALALAPDYRFKLWPDHPAPALPARAEREVRFRVHQCLTPILELHHWRPCGAP
jgi:hypothetical protein